MLSPIDTYEGLVKLRPDFAVKSMPSAKPHRNWGPTPECMGGGGITAYVVRPHAPNGASTVGAARIGLGAVLERRVATCGTR
jgi:hypothetical protein